MVLEPNVAHNLHVAFVKRHEQPFPFFETHKRMTSLFRRGFYPLFCLLTLKSIHS